MRLAVPWTRWPVTTRPPSVRLSVPSSLILPFFYFFTCGSRLITPTTFSAHRDVLKKNNKKSPIILGHFIKAEQGLTCHTADQNQTLSFKSLTEKKNKRRRRKRSKKKNFKALQNSHKMDCDVGNFSNNSASQVEKKKPRTNRRQGWAENKTEEYSERERVEDRDKVVHR